ncbi:MAG: helix-turn-helix domain-containing protein [Gammaproteobacteria bacterium]|nr:helix-turn-helix domain-containing protein [Gammaproteobacteria bacterium]
MTADEKTTGQSEETDNSNDVKLGAFVTELAAAITQNALQLAARTSEVPLRMAKAILTNRSDPDAFRPDHLKIMYDAGVYLRDMREFAGLTIKDLAAALDMQDSTLLESVEAGTATLPFETILRLASLVARNDPVPFVIRMLRSYNPEAWEVLQNWGIGRLPLQLERERQFINIYRGNDLARQLSDASFERVLEFTRSAFELSLQLAQESGTLDSSD